MDWQIGTDEAFADALNERAVNESLVALDTTDKSAGTKYFPRRMHPPGPAAPWDAAPPKPRGPR